MREEAEAPSSGGGSPRETAESEAEQSVTSTPGDPVAVKREASDEAEEHDQLEEDVKSQAESGARAPSPAPAVEALVALQAAGTKSQNAQFVHKLFAMVQTPSLHSLISWAHNGLSFSVFNPTEFSKSVLPMFFKHNNFQSFVRQLNMYGFHKVNDMLGTVLAGQDGVIAWEFQHASFQRDRPELLARIKRKSSKGNASSTTNPPSPSTGLASGRKSGHSSSSSSSTRLPAVAKERAALILPKEETPSAPTEAAVPAPRAAGVVVPESGYFERPPPTAGRASGTFHRAKVERDTNSPLRRSPPTLPTPISSYPHPNPHVSPRNAPYPLPPAAYPPSFPPRPQTADEGLSRQMAGLEAQVRSLGDALHYSQQENHASRLAIYSVIRLLVGVVEGMDSSDARKEDLQRCQAALAQLSAPQLSPTTGPPGSSGGPFAYSPFTSSAPWQPYAGNSSSTSTRSPRPTHSSAGAASQFFYQRPSAAESFARGGAGPSRRGSRDDSASPYPSSFNPLPTPGSSEPYSSRGAETGSSHGFTTRPLSSGFMSGSHSYPSPRPSWQGSIGSSGGRPSESASTTTLPPLSALFGGEGLSVRRPMTTEGEDSEEARKKARRV